MAADLSQLTGTVTGALTSSTAVAAYVSVAAAAVTIGLVVRFGPRLWRYLWTFISESDGHYRSVSDAEFERNARESYETADVYYGDEN